MNKLKQLSISLVLLSCFAIASKVEAMNFGYQVNRNRLMNQFFTGHGISVAQREQKEGKSELKIALENVPKAIARVSMDGLQEKDMSWIILAIGNDLLGIDGLKELIKFGLKKYVNYLYSPNPGITCLEKAMCVRNLEIVKLLVSIGAKIDKRVLDYAVLLREFDEKCWDGCIKASGIEEFLIAEKARQENAEKEKARMWKNFALPESRKISDVRIHFQDN